MATLRQDIITSATRYALTLADSGPVTNSWVAGWLLSGQAARVGADHGLDSAGLSDAVDKIDFCRLVSAINAAVSRERKRMDWLRALNPTR